MHLSFLSDKVFLFSTVAAHVTWYKGEEWKWIWFKLQNHAVAPSGPQGFGLTHNY